MNQKMFSVTDPRHFDGDPFDVAERSVAQVHGLLELSKQLLAPTITMVRNAELERQLGRGDKADAIKWANSAEGRAWESVEEEINALTKRLSALRASASFDPR